MKFKIAICILSLGICACGNQKQETNEQNKKDSLETSAKSSPINCYRYTHNNDTVTLKIIYVGKSITGTLVYNWDQKDDNKGTIQGNMLNDLLVVDYTFMSEGVNSARQAVFKKMDNSFIEGFGKIHEQNGKVVYDDLDSLNFDNSIPLEEINCRN